MSRPSKVYTAHREAKVIEFKANQAGGINMYIDGTLFPFFIDEGSVSIDQSIDDWQLVNLSLVTERIVLDERAREEVHEVEYEDD